jgi:formylmethanofuran dehydrogenase subunit E
LWRDHDPGKVKPLIHPDNYPPDLRAAAEFHGHYCPGLAIGYRAAKIGLERLGADRAEDEELIAIVESDSCAADAIQWLTGCTFGKGNLFFRDYGKHVYTFALRPSGRAVRVALKAPERRPRDAGGDRAAAIDRMLTPAGEAWFDVRERRIALPDKARVRESVICAGCGEPVMTGRTREIDGETLCIPCSQQRAQNVTGR